MYLFLFSHSFLISLSSTLFSYDEGFSLLDDSAALTRSKRIILLRIILLFWGLISLANFNHGHDLSTRLPGRDERTIDTVETLRSVDFQEGQVCDI